MMEHQLPLHPPLSLPGCRASQPLASHHHLLLCHHHHHFLHHHHHHCHCHHQHHHHHHNHHHFSGPHNPLCPQTYHFHVAPCGAASSLPPPAVSLPGQPQMGYSVSAHNHQNLGFPACEDAENSGVQLHEEWNEELEEEEEEPVFVMTDEWMEFFAKSEAKRRLEKNQAKKKKAKK